MFLKSAHEQQRGIREIIMILTTMLRDKGDVEPGECYFWSAYGRAELDLLIIKNGKRLGFEVKYTDSPKVTKSLLTAQQDLKVDEITVVYSGNETFPLQQNI